MKHLHWARASLAAIALIGCGSRTTFEAVEGQPPPPECTVDSDCSGFSDHCFPVACVSGTCQDAVAVDCNDGDVCTSDVCEPETGACSHAPATLDLDGDGYRSPLPGLRAGEADSCGTDCDDRNASAHPGGSEVCDGADNDCNGVVDDGASLTAVGDGVRISEEKSSADWLAYLGGSSYIAAYTGEAKTDAIYLARLAADGQRIGSATRFTLGPSDAQDMQTAWTGDRLGLAWSDRRDAVGGRINYEIYFNLANFDGTKRGPDVRVTRSLGFSIDPSLAWTGNEFVLLWRDDPNDMLGRDQLYAQRIDVNGALVGPIVKLIDDSGQGQVAPIIAAGKSSLGVVWTRTREAEHQLMFATFDPQLRITSAPTQLTPSMSKSDAAALTYNGSEYVIAWQDDAGTTSKQIFGTVRGERGEVVQRVKQLTQSPKVARYPDLLPYGDRVLLVWSDGRDDPLAWEIYAKTLSASLDSLSGEERLTHTLTSNSIGPRASFGPNGEVGILYTDNVDGAGHAYFTRLACLPGSQDRPPR